MELVELTWQTDQGSWTLRLTIERAGSQGLAPGAAPQPVQPVAALVGERGGAERWRRPLIVPSTGPCALP